MTTHSRRRILALLPPLLLAPIAGCGSSSPQPYRLLAFLDAINAGNEQDALIHVSSDFTLTLADGTALLGPGAVEALIAMPRPIRVRSVKTDIHHHALSTQMSFGSEKPVRVDVIGIDSSIETMIIHAGRR